MISYAEITGRTEYTYRRQLLRFIPPLDRHYLRDFYEKQEEELEKARRAGNKNNRRR